MATGRAEQRADGAGRGPAAQKALPSPSEGAGGQRRSDEETYPRPAG